MKKIVCMAVLLTCVSALAAKPPRTEEMTIEKNYLHIPVRSKDPNCTMKLTVDGETFAMFNQQMTVPLVCTLRSTEAGCRMYRYPIKELETLRKKTHERKDLVLKADANPLAVLQGDLFDVEIEFEPAAGTETVIALRGIEVKYHAPSQTVSGGTCSTRVAPEEGMIRLRILLDRVSLEVFGNDGRVYLSSIILPADEDRLLGAFSRNGEVKVRFLRVHELASAWQKGEAASGTR